MNIVASLVLYKHSFEDVQDTIKCLVSETCISKVVIVDNGNFCSWLLELSDNKIEIICTVKNSGFGAGHNHTINRYKKTASHILICNPDIHFEKGEVDKLLMFSIKNSTGLSTPKILYPDGCIQHGCRLLPSPKQLLMRRFFPNFSVYENKKYELHSADYSKPFYAPSISGCFMLLSQEALNLIDGFDPRFFMYLEDVDLSRRVCSAGLIVKYCPESTVTHESQRRSYTNLKFLVYHIESAFKYFNKWGWCKDSERDSLNYKCISELPIDD